MVDGRHNVSEILGNIKTHIPALSRLCPPAIFFCKETNMASPIALRLNGSPVRAEVDAQTPLLYALRNELGQRGPRFGCGLAQCGACTVHVDGRATRSCVVPTATVKGQAVTTLDGLAAQWRARRGITDPSVLHPVQQAFIDEQAAQCGFCINGWIMTAAALLEAKPAATDAELREGLSGLKCRCGTQVSVMRAVKRAARQMASAKGVA
jgi:aerobic-type carbon monoxide dehydrogenase small subunit (CoxS/CutS family)